MKLYYTTLEKSMAEQQNPSKSLGGYQSSSEVLNDVMGNLFSDISLNMMKDGKSTFRAIVLMNDSDAELKNVTDFDISVKNKSVFAKFTVVTADEDVEIDTEVNINVVFHI